MDNNFEQLVSALVNSSLSTDTITKITSILEEQISQSILSIVSDSQQSLLTLEYWAWQVLSKDFRQWIDEQSYSKLFHTLYSFNIKLILPSDVISSETKATLLIPSNNEWIDGILNQIETNNDTYLTIISMWFDVLSYLAHEQADVVYSPNMIHINNRLSREFVMTQQFKSYLQQLNKSSISQSIFTKKFLFYLKTCSFSLHVYFWSNKQNFPFTAKEIVQFLVDDYSQMILVQSQHVDSWSAELLSCIAHLTGLMCSMCWGSGNKAELIEMIIPPTDTTYVHILSFIRIVSHQPFHRYICIQWYNDENLLIDTILILLIGAVETQNLGCFITSNTNIHATLLKIVQTSTYDRICICAYGFLAIILSDAQLKELKIADNISKIYFNFLEQAWRHETKKWKKIPIPYLLKGFLSLSMNDTIQNATAHLQKISLFIELSDQYPIVYDIIWSLSFNSSIQEQLRSNRPFMAKLAKLEHEMNDTNISRSVNGILWILNSNRQETQLTNKSNDTSFDIMISYSHKDKTICKQLYDELIRVGYRVWIDFDQMHGNVMDAMAQAIEQSQTIIICMSEQYQRSNYCRAEAQYAFKRKLKMIPILLQKHYKPDGWLSFLISQLLYIDFTKYEFSQAIEMLLKELKLDRSQDCISIVPIKSNTEVLNKLVQSPSVSQLSSKSTVLPNNIQDWTNEHVHYWLTENNLPQMAHILSEMDGSSLIHFSEYVISGEPQKILSLLQNDSLKRTNETLSLIEFSRFRSLIEKNDFVELKRIKSLKQINSLALTSNHSKCCEIM